MSMMEFSAHEVRHMLLAIRNWLRSEEERRATREDGYVTLDAEVAESLGGDLGLDKPSAHWLVTKLIEEGYLEGEYYSTGLEDAPLRYAEIRGMSKKALEEME